MNRSGASDNKSRSLYLACCIKHARAINLKDKL
jgi:hypothetical protein